MPDWTRQAELSAYLVHNPHRKFGTILAVISPGWINEATHENWGSDGRALRGAIAYEPLDSEGHIGLLNLDRSEVSVFALDGQHRLMGLKGLIDLQADRLVLKDKFGNHKPGGKFPRSNFEEIGLTDLALQSLLSERMHIEYIPAILAGETRKEAVRRVRSVFFSLNAYAKKPTKGEVFLLSESDGVAIVARRVGITHPLLRHVRGDKIKDRVNWKNSALPDGSEWFTTLEALRSMVKGVMVGMQPDLVQKFKPRWNMVELRPSDDELDHAAEMLKDFLDHFETLPVINSINSSDDPTKELGRQRTFDKEGHGHLLLRPIGQEVLADAIGELIRDESMNLDNIFSGILSSDEFRVLNAMDYSKLKKKFCNKIAQNEKEALDYLVKDKLDTIEIEKLRIEDINAMITTYQEGDNRINLLKKGSFFTI
jgi:hypothetical protein